MLNRPDRCLCIFHDRKLLEQREEELQQQVRSLRLREAAMNKTNAEVSHRAQQLETRLAVLEAELGKAREEVRSSKRRSYCFLCTIRHSFTEVYF